MNEEEIIIEYSNGIGIAKIAKKIHKGKVFVRDILHKNNIITDKKNTYNESYFDTIDSREKAYFLGTLLGRGNIGDRDNTVSLISLDIDWLKKLSFFISKDNIISNNYSGQRPEYKMIIYSAQIKNSLLKLGLNPQKTLNQKFPIGLEERYYPDLIRGILDGDRYIYESGAFFNSTKEVISEISKYLDKHQINYKCGLKIKLWGLKITGSTAFQKLYNLIYKDTDLYLQSNKDMADLFLKNYQNELFQAKQSKEKKSAAKEEFYKQLEIKVKELFDQGLGSRSIAKKLNTSRENIRYCYQRLKLDTSNKTKPLKPIPNERECRDCGAVKKIEEFRQQGQRSYTYICSHCEEIYDKKHRQYLYLFGIPRQTAGFTPEEKARRAAYDKIYRAREKDTLRIKANHRAGRHIVPTKQECSQCEKIKSISEFTEINKKYTKYFFHRCKECVKNNKIKNSKEKIEFLIWSALKLKNVSDEIFCEIMPYTVKELKNHIESLFEPWMTWKNWGKYRVNSWDDNNSSTWKWNIDHIIPQSLFSYSSTEDEKFKQCWALENLRPYSAKQNIIDGVRKTRHKQYYSVI